MIRLGIDPGHGFGNRHPGRYDPGAVNGSNQEADIALLYGLTLKWVLHRQYEGRMTWFMTRDDDGDPTALRYRDDRAHAAGCDLFLSIHLNAHNRSDAHGTETLYGTMESKAMAKVVQKATLTSLGLQNRGLKHRPQLAVLRFPGPACLLELGFISNQIDLDVMLRRDNRLEWAEMTAAALWEAYGDDQAR